VTRVPAHILGLDGYGLEAGCRADCVLLAGAFGGRAIRLRAQRLAVVRAGRVIARTAPTTAELLPARSPDPGGFRRLTPRLRGNTRALEHADAWARAHGRIARMPRRRDGAHTNES